MYSIVFLSLKEDLKNEGECSIEVAALGFV